MKYILFLFLSCVHVQAYWITSAMASEAIGFPDVISQQFCSDKVFCSVPGVQSVILPDSVTISITSLLDSSQTGADAILNTQTSVRFTDPFMISGPGPVGSKGIFTLTIHAECSAVGDQHVSSWGFYGGSGSCSQDETFTQQYEYTVGGAFRVNVDAYTLIGVTGGLTDSESAQVNLHLQISTPNDTSRLWSGDGALGTAMYGLNIPEPSTYLMCLTALVGFIVRISRENRSR